MARFDAVGLFWEDVQATRGGPRELGPMPEIPHTGWVPPTEMPNIRHAKWIAFDCETYDPELDQAGPGWGRGRGHIAGLSCAVDGGKWYFPMRHEVQKEMNMDPTMVLKWAAWALGDDQPKVGANLMYDVGWLKQEGVEVGGPKFDVQFAEALLNETSKLALDSLGWKYLREGKDSDILKEWCQSYYRTSDMKWRKDIYRSPVTLAGPYGEQDAELPYKVLMKQWPLLVQRGLLDLFKMECDLIDLLVAMRFEGVSIDLPYVERLMDDFTLRAEDKQKQAERLAGVPINVNSGDSLAAAFDKLGLPYGRTEPSEAFPDGKPSFTANFLKGVKHPFAELVTEVKGLKKITSTFLKSYLLDSHVNGKVHCSFHPLSGTEGGARTGRFASSDPNLQNIPVRTEEGKMIRAAFIMDQGHLQVRDYDYSQIEYRMLAHFATGEGADDVRARYHNDPGLDYHDMIGDLIFDLTGIRLIRNHVKNINFGLVYGLGIETLAMYLQMSVAEAKKLSNSFHAAVPFASSTMDDISADTGRTGIVKTILGRQSHFDLWEPADWGRRSSMPVPYGQARAQWGSDIIRAYLYRATNYKLQGSAADIMKAAMVKCWKDGVFAETGIPRLTVHDELFFSDPGGRDKAFDEMRHIMETAVPCRVPLRADYEKGKNWAEAH